MWHYPLHAYARLGRVEEMDRYLHYMISHGVQAGQGTYVMLMQGHRLNGNPSR